MIGIPKQSTKFARQEARRTLSLLLFSVLSDAYFAVGSMILSHHNDSLAKCLRAIYSEHDWQEWRFVKSPQKYWKLAPETERLKFIAFLESKLGITQKSDWYKVQAAQVANIPGARSFLASAYNGSLITALESLIPTYEWHPWKFDNVSRKWWESVANRRKFLDFLGKELGITGEEQWYSVNPRDITGRGGYRLLDGYHHGNLGDALMTAYPEYDWKPWRFKHCRVPKGFWTVEANRRRFLEWLGAELGFQTTLAWAKLRRHDVIVHGGSSLLEDYFDQSIHSILEYMFPGHRWNAWELDSGAPRNFWLDKTNHSLFISALAEKLKIDRIDKWYSVSVGEVIGAGGGSFLAHYNNSVATALKSLIPSHPWDDAKFFATSIRGPVDFEALRSAVETLHFPPEAWYILEPSDVHITPTQSIGDDIWHQILRDCYPGHTWSPEMRSWRKSGSTRLILNFLALELFGVPQLTREASYSLTLSQLTQRFGAMAARKLASALPNLLVNHFESDHLFHPWVLSLAYDSIWSSKETRHRFLLFVARELKIESSNHDKWYSVSKAQLKKLGAGNLLKIHYENSLLNALKEVYPDKTWFPWPFNTRGSAGFWNQRGNIDLFVKELSSKLHIQTMEDWYKLSVEDFLQLHGRRLIAMHQNSPLSFLQHVFPSHRFEAWKFKRQSRLHSVSRNLSAESARAFADSVAKELHIKNLEDWYRVSYAQMKEIGAWYSADAVGGLTPLLRAAYPEHRWDTTKLSVSGKKSHQRDQEDVAEDYKHKTENSYVELDIYVPRLQLAFEYQGEYHYKDVLFVGETKDRGDKDVTKASLCAKAGITLISVPFWWDGSVESLRQMVSANRPDLLPEASNKNATEKK
jgi:hypothetical protein